MEEGREDRSRANSENRRTCWVCFGTDEDDPNQVWVQPCRCRGTTKWVHNICLQRWFDEKQHGVPTVKVFCPQCNTEYIVIYPHLGPLLVTIDVWEKGVNKLAPVLLAGVVVGSFYWSAVTFGGVSVLQVLGPQDGLDCITTADPLFLLVALPIIPFGLILGKMIRWEDRLLQLWRDYSQRWWFLKKIFGSEEDNPPIRRPVDTNSQMDISEVSRVLCGALMLPTIATSIGNYLFKKVESPVKRTFMGGGLYILLKGVVKLYYKQQQYIRLAQRQIQNYNGSTSV